MAEPTIREIPIEHMSIEGKQVTIIDFDGVVEIYVNDTRDKLGEIAYGGSPFRFTSFEEVTKAIRACTNHFELERLVLHHCFKPEYYNMETGTVVNFLPIGSDNINDLQQKYSLELSSRSGLNAVIANAQITLQEYWDFMDWLSGINETPEKADRLPMEVKQYLVEKGWIES